MMHKITVALTINGEQRQVETAANQTLLYLLRDDLGLTGTKDGCREGECGACTVLLDGEPVNSCLVLEAGAVQCGFCTPGAIMATVALLNRNPKPSEYQIREALVGNLCRCTGYNKMVGAVRLAAEEMTHG